MAFNNSTEDGTLNDRQPSANKGNNDSVYNDDRGNHNTNNVNNNNNIEKIEAVNNKHLLIFISQILILYIVIAVCLVNLTRGSTNSNLWTALLSSSIGYILPNPKFKRKNTTIAATIPTYNIDVVDNGRR